MSELPITIGDSATPILIPSEVTSQTPDTPDPVQQTIIDNVMYTENLNSTFSCSSGDPELAKLKGSFWKRAGQLQCSIGSLTGLKSWEETGRRTEQEASREYNDASSRIMNGEPSRLHGEYDKLMGYLSYAVGHIAGDEEMQERATIRTNHGVSEIDKTQKS